MVLVVAGRGGDVLDEIGITDWCSGVGQCPRHACQLLESFYERSMTMQLTSNDGRSQCEYLLAQSN